VYNKHIKYKGAYIMRVNINISDDLLKQIDEKAKSLYVSRSAYITLALVQKLQSDSVIDTMPTLVEIAKHSQTVQAEQLKLED
jgi:metal-responsive CopG/Arc/MetJ family transcriptional regulator